MRSVPLSSDKASYGVTLRAEPDHKTLGSDSRRLKPVMAEILDAVGRQTDFLRAKLTILGHDISMEDIQDSYVQF